jgi:hypothetical protein
VGDDLVAATHGRSFWVLDDVTPLRQIGPATAAEAMVLYAPQTALRLHYPDEVNTRRPVGENPPAGALIDYFLASEPKGELTIDIVGPGGAVVRHLSSTHSTRPVQPPEWPDQIVPDDRIAAKAGMNRLVWDLRIADPAQIPGAFYAGLAPRGPLVPPGRYQVRLTVGGQVRAAPLVVVADPRVKGAEAAIAAMTALALATETDIDRLHRAINAVRAAKADLQRVRGDLAARPAARPLAAGAEALAARLGSVEEALIQVDMKGSEANLAFPGMLNEQYASFAQTLDGADAAPTAQQEALYRSLHARLETVLADWAALRTRDLAAFNAALAGAGVGAVKAD